MRIGLASYRGKNKDVTFNLMQIETVMRKVQSKVDLICFGEAFLQGFGSLCWDYNIDKDMAVEVESPTIRQLAEFTMTYGVALMTGYIEKEKNSLYSSCIVIEDGKTVYNYRRISKGWKEFWKTDDHYKEGNIINEFEFRNTKIMAALCGDMWDFPEKFKTDHLLIWPVYVNFSVEEWEQKELNEYANQAALAADHVLMINPIDDSPQCHGGSFHFYKGQIITRLPFDQEKVLIVDMDKEIDEII